jgi:hypothetical protein
MDLPIGMVGDDLVHEGEELDPPAALGMAADDFAGRESMDGNACADQLCRDLRLEIGKGEDEVRLVRASVRSRANGTSACSPPLPSCRLASLRRSLIEPRLRTSRSPASPRPCSTPGVSRSGASDCDVSPATHARRHRSRRRKKRIVCRPKSLPKLWTSCRRPPDSPRVPCEPVSVCNRTGLRPAEREIRQLQGMSRTPGPERGEKEDGQNIE